MKLQTIKVATQSAAAPHAVFALLKDGSTWPQWSSFDAFELERAGLNEPFGLGAIRVFITRVSRAREEVVALIPDRQLGYILLSGLPFRDYRAEVTLDPLPGGGTRINWHSRFYAKYWGTGWFWRLFMMMVLNDIAKKLAKASETCA